MLGKLQQGRVEVDSLFLCPIVSYRSPSQAHAWPRQPKMSYLCPPPSPRSSVLRNHSSMQSLPVSEEPAQPPSCTLQVHPISSEARSTGRCWMASWRQRLGTPSLQPGTGWCVASRWQMQRKSGLDPRAAVGPRTAWQCAPALQMHTSLHHHLYCCCRYCCGACGPQSPQGHPEGSAGLADQGAEEGRDIPASSQQDLCSKGPVLPPFLPPNPGVLCPLLDKKSHQWHPCALPTWSNHRQCSFLFCTPCCFFAPYWAAHAWLSHPGDALSAPE